MLRSSFRMMDSSLSPMNQRSASFSRLSPNLHKARMLSAWLAIGLLLPHVVETFTAQHVAFGLSRRGAAETHCTMCLSVSTVQQPAPPTFDFMSHLRERLEALESTAPTTLFGFYEPHLASFSVQPGASGTTPSITSTCYTLLAIHAAANDGDLYESALEAIVHTENTSETVASTNRQSSALSTDGPTEPILFILRQLLTSPWRVEDLFQTSLLLYTWLTLDPHRTMVADTMVEENIRKLIAVVVGARPKRRNGLQQLVSEYIAFLSSSAFVLLQDGENERRLGSSKAPSLLSSDEEISELSLGLLRSAEISHMEVCFQLAARVSHDTGSFDVVRLAYALQSYVKTTRCLASTTTPESPETPTRLNPRIVDAALKVLFEEQRTDGLWEQGQPIYKSFRRKGRNIGNAFVFSVDTVGSLLSVLPAESFRPYLNNLARTLDWIETHQSIAVIPDYCDPKTGQCYGKSLQGWTSPFLSDSSSSGPYAWSTAQVCSTVTQMRVVVKKLLHADALAEFKGSPLSKNGPDPQGWNRLLDSDLGRPGSPDYSTLKDVLESRIIIPFQDSVSNPSFGAAYSSILFGPPGTAKSTVCESLAARLGWDFVVIDTSAFLADGLSNVASRIRYVFERLMSLERTIILFDEVEEFMLDRETPGLAMESRMLTTAMLTAINDLRRAQRSVFFVATNRLRALDAAIIRPGRFDMQLFVGTPNLPARIAMFRQALVGQGRLEEAAIKEYTDEYTNFLEDVWDEDARFMNYLEGKQYADAVAKLILESTDGSLSRDALRSILEKQASVMTVRGSVREDFLASMGMSRI